MISVLIVSNGRKSLKKTLDSIFKGLNKYDDVTLVLDGVTAPPYLSNYDTRLIVVKEEHKGFWGHPHRETYQSKLKGKYILNFDDDDILNIGWRRAIDILIRRFENPDILLMSYILNSTGLPAMYSNEHLPISPITGNVIFKNRIDITREPWEGYSGDFVRCMKLIQSDKYKFNFSDFPLFTKH